ncbi:hypothetical protein GT025_19885 [Streptomyces sp. SID4920]|nr:hypothetical protein [Streptomyces sp. SID4920]MYX63938.1 hypothetical protein [Streptomyces sp. SID8373]
MDQEERELKRFGYTLFAGMFAGLGVGALVAVAEDGGITEVMWSASGAGSLGITVAALIGLTRMRIFRD